MLQGRERECVSVKEMEGGGGMKLMAQNLVCSLLKKWEHTLAKQQCSSRVHTVQVNKFTFRVSSASFTQ